EDYQPSAQFGVYCARDYAQPFLIKVAIYCLSFRKLKVSAGSLTSNAASWYVTIVLCPSLVSGWTTIRLGNLRLPKDFTSSKEITRTALPFSSKNSCLTGKKSDLRTVSKMRVQTVAVFGF